MDFSWLKSIVEKIQVSLNINRQDSPTFKEISKSKTVDKSTHITINQPLSVEESRNLIRKIVHSEMTNTSLQAIEVFKERRLEFEHDLVEKTGSLSDSERARLSEPDAQVAVLRASRTSGQIRNKELRSVLSTLVIRRIRDTSADEDIVSIVYNEAIKTMEKLTIDQLKIIAICFILGYTMATRIDSWEELDNYFKTLSQFLDFKNTQTEFQHIEYAGCGSIQIGKKYIVKMLKRNYTLLFKTPIKKADVDRLSLAEDLWNSIGSALFSEVEDNNLTFRFRNSFDLEDYTDQHVPDDKVSKALLSLFNSNVLPDSEAKKEIEERTKDGSMIIDIWENSNLKHLTLTSVGIAIAATYFEEVTSEKLEIAEWIK